MTKQSEIVSDTNYIPVLDHGFVGLIDVMGTDAAVVQAARVSYGAGTKTVNEDRGLIRYLLRHRHCYHPDMQVLTTVGWKRWGDCDTTETFLVPDPSTRTYREEQLSIVSFDVDEELYTFSNERMSYKVTSGHKMWFKGKYRDEFAKIAVEDMPLWGWFDPIAGYKSMLGEIDGDDQFRFIGFYLGDGSYASPNRVNFHLKKDRKKEFLTSMLDRLGFEYTVRPSATCPGATLYSVTTPDVVREWIDVRCRAAEKSFPMNRLRDLTVSEKNGLLDGLMNSDGSAKPDRNSQYQFSSTAPNLIDLVQALAPVFGYDAHRTSCATRSVDVVTAYAPSRTSLESRKQYHGREHYRGKVYCATTSTGLLAVRGEDDKYGFVCGNTTPFEMCEVKFHIKMPILVARQWIRHRTANVNEYSGRYSLMSDEFYLPEIDVLMAQSETNNQGRGGDIDPVSKDGVRWLMQAAYDSSYEIYEILHKKASEHDDKDALPYDPYDDASPLLTEEFPGVARELARSVLPVGNYTELYWKIDLHNLMHFLRLRLDSHAQYEIRVFAQALYDLVAPRFPIIAEAFEDYVRGALTLSRMEKELIAELLCASDMPIFYFEEEVVQKGGFSAFAKSRGMSVRELREFCQTWGFDNVLALDVKAAA